MSVPAEHGRPVGSLGARGAWVWVWLTPLGWLAGLIVGLQIVWIEAYGPEGEHAGPMLWLMFEVLLLAAPTMAVILAIWKARAGSQSGEFALGVAGVVLLLTMFLFVMFAVGGAPGAQIPVAIVGAAVAAAVGLTWRASRKPVPPALEHAYWADLTTGHGDFPAITTGTTTTSYQPDGFHLRSAQPGGFRPAAVSTPKPCTAAEVTATVTEVTAPAGAGFGPWCFDDPDNGYGMALAPDGQVTITHLDNGNPAVIGGGHAAAWLPGQSRNLTIVCQVGDTGDTVAALVDGAKVASTAAQSAMPDIKATGVAGAVPQAASGPGEWAVTSFARDVPGDS